MMTHKLYSCLLSRQSCKLQNYRKVVSLRKTHYPGHSVEATSKCSQRALTKKPATVRSLQPKFQFNFETVSTTPNLNLKEAYYHQVQVTAPTFTKG